MEQRVGGRTSSSLSVFPFLVALVAIVAWMLLAPLPSQPDYVSKEKSSPSDTGKGDNKDSKGVNEEKIVEVPRSQLDIERDSKCPQKRTFPLAFMVIW